MTGHRGRLEWAHDIHFPVIVKPGLEDGSIGIRFSAVVGSLKELMERIDQVHADFDGPVLIEEYIEGREIYVAVLGNQDPERCRSSSSISRSCRRARRGSPVPR
jgi:D-alanine-D-alanine ligase